ncbi:MULTISPECIES: hypothetical protein [Epilithonimonas]|jgi:hypothetical protein|uniref:Uncharacterized protein n=2 Tax=Epilithonimonas TaxID=2782229 RepID=A0A420DE57_9FLAO|nr:MULTISPECIES: hypothetical protein [Epilithonimonas]RKE90063.1 hypothetical protein BXY58_0649 [Epilithonimonas arachidiradicis]SMP96388.1 hypothetical protein SAMN05421679_10917 [Epilithonimonas pallida]
MKKNDTLTTKALTPKKEIIDFLLNYSKNIQPIKTKNRKIVLVSKN